MRADHFAGLVFALFWCVGLVYTVHLLLEAY